MLALHSEAARIGSLRFLWSSILGRAFADMDMRRLCPMLNGTQKNEDANPNGDSSFGAVPAPLTL